VALGVAAAVVLGGPPSASEIVTRAEAYIRKVRTVHVLAQVRAEEPADSGSTGANASTLVHRASIRGDAAFPNRFHVTVESEGAATEIIGTGGKVYVRTADPAVYLPMRKWAAYDPDKAEARAGIVAPQGGVNGAPAADLGDPSLLPRLLAARTGPPTVRRNGELWTVRLTADPQRALGQGGSDGRPERARLDLSGTAQEGGRATAVVDYRFSRWGLPVTISVPSAGALDPTPGIEEEDIANYDKASLLQPAGIPTGWALTGAEVLPAKDTAEGCDQVELDYEDPNNAEAAYLTLYELPVGCADKEVPDGARAFAAGPARGWVQVDKEQGVSAQILLGTTAVQADTDLPPEELAKVLEHMVGLDFKVKPAPIPGIGHQVGAA